MATLTVRFDPIEYTQKLRSVGVSQEQAEIQAQTIEKVINEIENNQELVNKKDLSEFKLETKRDLAELKLELIKWIIGTGVAGVVAIAGLLKFMVH